MIVNLKTLPVTPDAQPITDTISSLATIVPDQIDQTRKQITQLVSSPVAQAAALSTATALGGGTVLAAPVVAELAMSAIENKVYEATSPSAHSASLRSTALDLSRQELFLKAEAVELENRAEQSGQNHEETPWAIEPQMRKEPEGLFEDPNQSAQQVGSILDRTFGIAIDRERERQRIASALWRPILPWRKPE